jgi:hypothetical protein
VKRILLSLSIVFAFLSVPAQNLNIEILFPTQDTTICSGDTVILQAASAFLLVDFNNGQLGVGWSATQANPVFTNPCGPGPVGSHAWVGTTASQTRTLETNSYNLVNGSGCFVEFWMKYGQTVGGAGPCETPDVATEGVHLQYQVNNGAWVDFPGPNINPVGFTVNTQTNPLTFNTTVPGSGGYWTPVSQNTAAVNSSTLYYWNFYKCPIPAAAISPNTKFRWAQLVTSNTGFDAWGIDEVYIGCIPPNIIWTPTGTTTIHDTVSPLVYTQYIVTVFDSLGNTASDTINIDVIPPPRLANDITALCEDSVFIITVDAPILCSSVSADGSDFRMDQPNGINIPIVSAVPINCQNGYTTTVAITALFPVTYNGEYNIWVKLGNDGTTLRSECGAVPEFDSIKVTVGGCYEIYMDLLNVTIVNDDHPAIEWEIDSDTTFTFVQGIFEEYRILRSLDPIGPYTQIGVVNNINQTTYEDLSLTSADVNANAYNYAVRAVYDGGLSTTSDSIQSILLECADNSDTLLLDMTWTSYWGWPSPEYRVLERGLGGTWSLVTTTINTNYTHTKPEDADTYTMKVETINPVTGTLVSESNYCDYDVYAKDPKLKMPNVFTPQGNFPYYNAITANDSTVNLVKFQGYIYNRWGKKLYEWTNWEDMSAGWDGEGAPEGTYYYVVKAEGESGEILEEQGFFMLIRQE